MSKYFPIFVGAERTYAIDEQRNDRGHYHSLSPRLLGYSRVSNESPGSCHLVVERTAKLVKRASETSRFLLATTKPIPSRLASRRMTFLKPFPATPVSVDKVDLPGRARKTKTPSRNDRVATR